MIRSQVAYTDFLKGRGEETGTFARYQWHRHVSPRRPIIENSALSQNACKSACLFAPALQKVKLKVKIIQ